MGLGTGVWHDAVVTGIVAGCAVAAARPYCAGAVPSTRYRSSVPCSRPLLASLGRRVDVVLQSTGRRSVVTVALCLSSGRSVVVDILTALSLYPAAARHPVRRASRRQLRSCSPPAVTAVIQV